MGAQGIAVDASDGSLWVSDRFERTVYNVERNGTLIRSIASDSYGSLDPTGVAYDPGTSVTSAPPAPAPTLQPVTTRVSYTTVVALIVRLQGVETGRGGPPGASTGLPGTPRASAP